MKDPRFYIVPIVSVILIALFLANPGMTGLIVGTGGPASENSQLSGKIRITVLENIIPEDSVVTVYIGNQNSSMPVKEFMEKSGEAHELAYGRIPEIGYEGRGYAGRSYTLDLSEFGLDLYLAPGEYTLITEVSYGNFVISNTSEDILV
jgi:hypothetical protein